MNEGLKEIGKALLNLANLLLVLFLINSYLMKNDHPSIHIVIVTVYAVAILYVGGYLAINNKGEDYES